MITIKNSVDKNRGFTLVEVIVVLVILGILAAIGVPSLIGYIRKAQRESLIVECRHCVAASQTILVEAYAEKVALVPSADDVIALAEMPGTVSAIEIDSDAVMTKHLTYTKGGMSVIYCSDFVNCDRHDETFNFEDGEGGSGGGDEGEGGGESGGSDDVTLTDSEGNTHVLSISANWNEIQDLIKTRGWNIMPGGVFKDETGIYIYESTASYMLKNPNGLTLEEISKQYPAMRKLESSNTILTSADIRGSGRDQMWKKDPRQGDICFYNGSYYITQVGLSIYTFPPEGWIKIPQKS